MNTTTFRGGSLVSLLFLDGSESPAYVLRIPRVPSQPERVLANYDALRFLLDIPLMRSTVPEPVFAGQLEEFALTVETCKHGRALLAALDESRSDADRIEALMDQALEWAWDLHSNTRVIGEPAHPHSAFEDLQCLAANNLLDPESVSRAREAIEQALASNPHYSYRHGDLNPNNVLVSDSGVTTGVVDWEYADFGLSVLDVFAFARTGLFDSAGEREAPVTRIEGLLDGEPPAGPSLWKALPRYASRDNFRPLFFVYVVRMISDFVRATGNPNDPQIRPWLSYLHSNTRSRWSRAQRRRLLAETI